MPTTQEGKAEWMWRQDMQKMNAMQNAQMSQYGTFAQLRQNTQAKAQQKQWLDAKDKGFANAGRLLPMGGMGGGGMGMQGGMFRIAPKREFKRALTTVCLEHGRPDPNPKMAYTIIPLDKVTKDGRVHALCEALGSGQIAQNTAQAAAWHLTDDLSWQKLASMNKAESKYTGNIRWFSPLELRAAQAVVSEVTRMANAASEGSQSESESESNYTQTTATSLSSKK